MGNLVHRMAILSGVLLGIAGLPVAHAATLNVPSQYRTIQAAVNAAQHGDIVAIAAGTYREDVRISRSVANGLFWLLITGAGSPTETVIEGSVLVHLFGAPPPAERVIFKSLTIRGLTRSREGVGINLVAVERAQIIDCIVERHRFDGIKLQVGSHVEVIGSLVRDNLIGIANRTGTNGGGSIIVRNSVVSNNGSTGIFAGTGPLTIRGSAVVWNGRAQPSGAGVSISLPQTPPSGTPPTNRLTMGRTFFLTNRDIHVSMAPPPPSPFSVELIDEGGNTFLDFNTMSGSFNKKVLCTQFFAQGLLSPAWYQADSAYAARFIDPATNAAYRIWAEPLTRLVAHSRLMTQLARPVVSAWAQHMAYVMGAAQDDSRPGRWLNTLGVPLHRWIGAH